MSQDKDLSSLTPVKPDPGTYQWVKGKVTGIDEKQEDRTHTVGVPPPPNGCASGRCMCAMSARTVIFPTEWWRAARTALVACTPRLTTAVRTAVVAPWHRTAMPHTHTQFK